MRIFGMISYKIQSFENVYMERKKEYKIIIKKIQVKHTQEYEEIIFSRSTIKFNLIV